jgi:hypothetical protein
MTEQTELKTTGDEAAKVALEKRRRLLKLGVSAAPVVLTLASRSALACHCKSPSAAGSVTFNSHKPAGTVQDGQFEGTYDISPYVKTYAAWMTYGDAHSGSLPGSVTKTTRLMNIPLFATAFGGDNTKILSATGFRRDIVTAYLNLSNGPIIQGECLTLLQLKAMASGTYTDPASGATFDSGQIQAYLANNWLLG